MERHASLASRNLAVTMEQVSIFLHDDNTVTSFFESDIDEIEEPILQRLTSSETLLQQSCDASMLLQAILDALVGLALSMTVAYQDVLGDLELEVLTHPDIEQSKRLYVLTSEISFLRNSIHSVLAVINALREHRPPRADERDFGTLHHNPPNNLTQTPRSDSLSGSNIAISSMFQIYLGDVIDHLIPIVEEYDEIRRAADSMIDLIFNMIATDHFQLFVSANGYVQNFFMKMKMLSGTQAYFGMNFNKKEFAGIKNSVSYVLFASNPLILLEDFSPFCDRVDSMTDVSLGYLFRTFIWTDNLFSRRDKIIRFFITLAQRQLIVSSKKQRQKTGHLRPSVSGALSHDQSR
ncbi:hypothetical protein N7493_009443 [Penicillium malachiteum]|uniref:Uncharacterized protein n=1 Tax=Penicillium malachiteum TaxID=1324776 RepID=A0AAD6MSE6_9EURO|nr:hypothetical protein N7493_009443 [Penicillium malachiteum]